MIPSTQRTFAALVISLVIQVISLTGMAFALPPSVTTLDSVTDGVITPVRIATGVDGTGKAVQYVTDPRAGGVLVINDQRSMRKLIRTLAPPKGVAIGTAGSTSGKLLVSQGTFVSVIDPVTGTESGKLGIGIGQFSGADGIAVDAAGYIYVVDAVAKSVKMFDANGGALPSSTLSSWTGGPATTFTVPSGIAYEKANNQIAVTDAIGGRILFFNLSGGSKPSYAKFTGAQQTRSLSFAPLVFMYPTGVAFEYASNLLVRMYVVDSFNGLVQMIDPTTGTDVTKGTGTFIDNVGSYGSGPGKLTVPSDVAFDNVNKLLLVANGDSSIAAFGIGGGAWPSSVSSPMVAIATVTENADGSVQVCGTASNADVLNVIVKPATYPVTPTGSWCYTVNSGFVTGPNTVTARATNTGFDVATDSRQFTWADPNGSISINPIPFTNLTLLPVTGTVTAGATVSVCNTTTNAPCVTAAVDGTAWTALVSLQAGANTVTANATWPTKLPKTVTTIITLDSTPPALTVSAISGGSTTSTQLQNITGIASDANGVTIAVTVNTRTAMPVSVSSGFFSTAVVLSHGANKITVEATDAAGNKTSNTRFVTFDIDDADRPVVTIISDPLHPEAVVSDLVSTQLSSVTLTGSALIGKLTPADFLTVAGQPVSIDASGNWTATAIPLGSGMNTVDIVATSVTGKTSEVKRTLYRYALAPELAITAPLQDFATNAVNNVGIAGNVTGTATVSATYDQVSVPVTKSGSTFSIDLTLPVDLTGNDLPHTLVVTATDSGNTSVTARNILVDRTVPPLTVSQYTPTAICGTSSLDGTASVLVKIFGSGTLTPVGTMTQNGDGSWCADMTGVAYDPASTVVTATDVAGNQNSNYPKVHDGDINVDGIVNMQDPIVCLQLLIYNQTPTLLELGHGDCAPTVSDGQGGTMCSPDGIIGVGDCLLILRKAVGLPTPLSAVK